MRNHFLAALVSIVLTAVLISACGPSPAPVPPVVATNVPPTAAPTAAATAKAEPANPDLILATTTSTQDSGLLDVLIPMFEAETGYSVKVVAVGSGQALEMGQQGNADVLLVHAPASEKKFMADGFGTDRFLVMHNYFMIVGPAADPAGIKGGTDAVKAFTKIYQAGGPFASRGDDSGTHKQELALWKGANLDPAAEKPAWYIETGQGMGATLTIASEKGTYTFTDRGTYLATQANLDLEAMVQESSALLNAYHVMTVNAGKWPKVNYDGAIAFAKWLTETETQEVIGKFGIDKYGEALFIPDADKTDADLGL